MGMNNLAWFGLGIQHSEFPTLPIKETKYLKKVMVERTTPKKTNMSPENQWVEDVFPIELVLFQGTC